MNNERVNATTLGLQILAVAGLMGICAWFAIELTRPADGVTVVWVASGLLVGILLTSAYRLWPAYVCAGLLGNLVARIAYGDPLLDAIVRSVTFTVEICIVAYALRLLVGNVTDPANLRQVARVAIASTLVPARHRHSSSLRQAQRHAQLLAAALSHRPLQAGSRRTHSATEIRTADDRRRADVRPDRANGRPAGDSCARWFYSMTYDITELQAAKQ